MEFRPCIDIHNGKVKQIVGESLQKQEKGVIENFVSEQDGAFFASLYQKHRLKGGHVILLNSKESEYYAQTRNQALKALEAYPGGLQIGGGINGENAGEYLEAGASHVIVTSYVFQNGKICYENLNQIVRAIGSRHLVLDVSCRKKNDRYSIVTDQWRSDTDLPLSEETLEKLSRYCDEFLVHGVDVEGKSGGIEEPLVEFLGKWSRNPVTYAGGIHSFEDLSRVKKSGQGRVNVTIGSALDLFGGHMNFQEVLSFFDDPSCMG